MSGAKVTATGSLTSRTLEARFADVVNVKDYGAIGDGSTNDTTAVAAALAALGSSNGALYFPAGTYLLNSSTLAKTLTGAQSIKVYGDGADASILYFPNNGDGLSFTFTAHQFAWIGGNNLVMEDLAFVTNVQNTGKAVAINGASAIGDPTRPTIFSRCGFRGTLNNNSYWTFGIHATDIQNLVVNDCYSFGFVLGLLGTAVRYIGTTNSTHPTVVNVHNLNMQFGDIGVHCTGYIEGLNVNQSNITQVNYGVLWDSDAALPQCSVTNSQINAKTIGVNLIDATACQITGNLFFVTDTAAAGAPAIAGNPLYSTITGNTFIGLNGVDLPNGIILQSGAEHNVISGNVFKGFATNNWLQSGANNNIIGRNRHVDGTPVVNSGTGNVFWTETSAAFSPGASDGNALGTTALMWSDLFLAEGGAINWDNGDVTITQTGNTLAFAGASTAYTFDAPLGIGGTPSSRLHVMEDLDAGTVQARIHNTGDGNVTTKLAALGFYGTDTVAAVKEVGSIEAVPNDANWIGARLDVYTRAGDAKTIALRFGDDQSVKAVSPTGGLGYGTGAGGTVTQATNKTTGVTLNKVCGQITLAAGSIAAGGEATFALTNSAIATTDVVLACHDSVGASGSYDAFASNIGAGSCNITVTNVSAGALDEQIVLNFAVIKVVAA